MEARNREVEVESAVRDLVDGHARAVSAKDAETVFAQYSPDKVMFVLAPPLQITPETSPGRKARAEGGTVDMKFRSTPGLRKIGGRWKIAHPHDSVPFPMDGSAKAAIDLRP